MKKLHLVLNMPFYSLLNVKIKTLYKTHFDNFMENDKLTDEAKEYAKLAEISYLRTLAAKEKAAGQLGYDIVDSSEYTTLYENKNKKRKVMSFRGTKLSDINDLGADLDIALGTKKFRKRINDTIEDANNMIDNNDWNNDETLVLASHSLGAHINDIYAASNPEAFDHVYNFNKGSGIEEVRKRFKNPFERKVKIIKPPTTNFYVKGDLLSTLGTYKDHEENVIIQAKKNAKNVHSIENFY